MNRKHCLLSLSLLSATTLYAAQENIKPNILMIVVDDLGYADFPVLAGDLTDDLPITNINRLTENGRTYTQAYVTAPVSSPSRAGLMTGRNQFRWDRSASWSPGLPEKEKTIPEYLKQAGYDTAQIGKNDFGKNYFRYDVREYPLKHGYDFFLGFSAHAHDFWHLSERMRDITPDPDNTSAHLGPLMYNMSKKSYESGYLTEILTDEALEYMKKERNNPYFLTLAYNSVHHLIHEVPEKYLEKFGVEPIHKYNPDMMESYKDMTPGSYAAYYEKYSRIETITKENMRKYYLANLNCLDDQLGRIFDFIEKSGQTENTLIVLISDNGGSPITGANNYPLTAGKYSLWEGGIRVPLTVSWPGKMEQGVEAERVVSSLDLLPTFLQAAGLESTGLPLDGESLLNTSQTKDRTLIWKWQKNWAIRSGRWKLIKSGEAWGKGIPSDQYIRPIESDGSWKLFDLSTDPGERINLAADNRKKVQELRRLFLKKN